MSVEFVLRDVEVSPYTKENIRKKTTKLLSRVPQDVSVRIKLAETKTNFRAQVTMTMKGKEIIGSGSSKNILAAVDEAVARADRQLTKRYGKETKRRERGRDLSADIPSESYGVM